MNKLAAGIAAVGWDRLAAVVAAGEALADIAADRVQAGSADSPEPGYSASPRRSSRRNFLPFLSHNLDKTFFNPPFFYLIDCD